MRLFEKDVAPFRNRDILVFVMSKKHQFTDREKSLIHKQLRENYKKLSARIYKDLESLQILMRSEEYAQAWFENDQHKTYMHRRYGDFVRDLPHN